jgi:membrane protease YdiL (CAAX protease family)
MGSTCAPPRDGRRRLAIALPVVVPLAMAAIFTTARGRFGPRRGYTVGFCAYWATSAAASIVILGPGGVRELWSDPRPRLGRRPVLGALLLTWPPLGAIVTRLIPEVRTATPTSLAISGLVAFANATTEEVLWRGVYLRLWPDDPWLGYAWPSLGFGLWHLAPQEIHPSPMGPLRYVAAATVLGLSWGWVARRTGSLRWVALSHVVTDASGLRNASWFG